jgi:hypothetical protein
MAGARAEYQWRGLVVGLNLDYAYVYDFELRIERGYNTMALYPVIGYMISLGSPRFRLPVMAAGGWIPMVEEDGDRADAGLLRFEAGLAYRPSDRVDLRFIFVCPNFWFMRDETVLFVTFSLQVVAGI